MFSLIKLFSKQKSQSFTIVEISEIPFHIKEIAKLYPILHTVAANKALGEIRKFEFLPHKENSLRVGQAHLLRKNGLDQTWIHLGNDFFKLIMKA